METSTNNKTGLKKKLKHLLLLDRPPIRITHRIRTSKAGIIGGIALMAVMFLVIFLNWNGYFHSDLVKHSAGQKLFIISCVLAVLAGLTTALRIYLPIRWIRRTSIVYYLLIPFLSLLMSEAIQGYFIYDLSPLNFGLNMVLFLVLFSIPAVFTGRLKPTILIMTPLIWLFSVTSSYILIFRATPFMPADIATIGTGLEVAAGYDFDPPAFMILGTWIFIELLLLTIKMPIVKIRPKYRNIFRVLSLAIVLLVLVPFYTTDIAANNNIKPDFWNQARGYKNQGTVLGFVLNTRYLIAEVPEGYDPAEVPDLINDVLETYPDAPTIFEASQAMQAANAEKAAEEAALAEDGTEAGSNDIYSGTNHNLREPNTGMNTHLAVEDTSTMNQPAASAKLKNGQTPNIIVIMNETLGDLRVLGDLSTNKDYFPFLRNLTKNTIKGNMYVPVNGAGTSNTEYEALTGNTMALLPAGSNAYQLYVDSPIPSLTKTLAAQNYSSIAYHTYYRAGWRRSLVYPLMGFDKFVAIEDLFGEELMESYQNGDTSLYEYERQVAAQYPDFDGQILMRRFVTDAFDYDRLIKMYEEKDADKPFYIFNVTMQNHGGYTQAFTNFNEQVQCTSVKERYPKANRYLSLMYESDLAMKELIDYFSHTSDPTMIVMFGDHQPSIESTFVEEVMGKSLSQLTVEENQRRYVTPFFIWTNYDSESGYIEKISTNYLSTLILQQAGLKTTKFNDYLSAMYSVLPVIDTTGYITADNVYYTYDNETQYTNLINDYAKIGHNFLFDDINKATGMFTVQNE